MVFQNYALYPHLTVYENIAFPLRLAGASATTEVDEKVRDASKTLELDEHLERKPGNLSGGQRQRVAMGRAIVREAEAFLFDEPLSNLDAKLRGQMRTEISRLQKRLGITTVYVTHDQTEAMTLGDRVAVLKRGILQQLATPRELYEQPGQPVRRRLHRLAADELPAGDGRGQLGEAAVRHRQIPADKAEKAAGQGAADRRHPPRALRGRRGRSTPDKAPTGSTFRAKVDVVEWLGNEAYAYIPFEAPPEVAEQLAAARARPRRRGAAHPAGRVPRRRQPDQGGRRGRDLGRRPQDPPLRPGHGREPHDGRLARPESSPVATPWRRPRRSGASRTRSSRARTPPPPDPRSSGPAGRRGTRPREHRSRGLAASGAPARRPQPGDGATRAATPTRRARAAPRRRGGRARRR